MLESYSRCSDRGKVRRSKVCSAVRGIQTELTRSCVCMVCAAVKCRQADGDEKYWKGLKGPLHFFKRSSCPERPPM